MAKFKPLISKTKSQDVFESIRYAIFDGKFLPGEPLKIAELANSFQVSQASIREAILQLEKLGLVVKIPHRGTTVIKMSENEIADRLKVRFHLEELCFNEAAKNMTESDFKYLDKLNKRLNNAVKKGSFSDLSDADINFHRFIWEKSNNKALYETLDFITIPLFAYLGIEHHTLGHDISKTVHSHDNIILALKSKNKKEIRNLNREIMKHSYSRFLKNGNDHTNK